MKRLAVVIVNYNSADYLARCLDSLERNTREDSLGIVVVDNASRDQDFSQMRRRHARVRFILNSENLGFSAACNQGVRSIEARFYLLLNPDCEVREEALDRCLDFFEEHPKAGIVGARVLHPDGRLQLACRRSIPRPRVALFRLLGLSRLFPRSRIFGAYNLTYLDEFETARVEAVSGSFLMFRREVFRQTGGMDEDFFLYGEDLDFCYRAAQKGWRAYYLPQAAVVHHKQKSAASNPEASLYHFYHAMRLFHRKHFAPRSSRLTNALVNAAISLAYRLHRLRRRDGGGSKW